MSYRLIRLFFTLAGVLALAGFGLSFSDFVQNRATYLQPFDPRRLQSSIKEYSSNTLFGHLKAHDPHFQVLHLKEASGWVKPLETLSGAVAPPPPKPKIGPDDLEVILIQYSSVSARAAAFLRPTDAPSGDPSVGGFYRHGEEFEIESKEGLTLFLKDIRRNEVEIGIKEDDFSFVLTTREAEIDTEGRITVMGSSGEAVSITTNRSKTEEVVPDTFELGSDDIRMMEEMPEDEILAAVQVGPARDATGEVVGLKIKSIKADSPFAHIGLQNNDIVLQVNGLPTTDRAEVIRFMRQQEPGQTLHVLVERLGRMRSLTYRLPR